MSSNGSLSDSEGLAGDSESLENQRLLHEEKSHEEEIDNKPYECMGARRYALLIEVTYSFTFSVVVVYLLWILSSSWKVRLQDPTLARTLNGTYEGIYRREHEQYAFLGMPYALPPVGAFRFRQARSLNTSWDNIRRADRFGLDCYGYGVSSLSQFLR
jgi:hypothetical protein